MSRALGEKHEDFNPLVLAGDQIYLSELGRAGLPQGMRGNDQERMPNKTPIAKHHRSRSGLASPTASSLAMKAGSRRRQGIARVCQ